eukprot:1147935-Pelagomonas_calceolata.AAC.1
MMQGSPAAKLRQAAASSSRSAVETPVDDEQWVWHWASCSYAWSPWLRRARSKLLSGVPQVQCVECFVKEEEWLA